MTDKKSSLITCDRVYYQLKWHDKADQKKAYLKYANFGKLKTVPYHDWIPIDKGGEIPWHRIYQILYGDKILWDRESRFYNPDLLNQEEFFSNKQLLKFEGKDWKEVDNNKQNLPDIIKILSFNCLIDTYNKNVTNLTPRIPVILHYLEKYNADIICLQEITIKSKKLIMENKFIRENYYITSNEPKIFGQLMLTKYIPLAQNLVAFNGNHMKKYLQMIFSNSNDELIEIYNIHLTSNQQKNSDKKRDEQIDQLFSELRESKIIIAGDFNNDDIMNYNDFKDTWLSLRKDDGFTFDYIENGLTSKTTTSFIRTRIDKILFRDLKPININLAFDKSINKVWASDHFGLISEFNLIESFNESDVIDNNIIVKPGTILCLNLEPKYWKDLNKIRKKYDDHYHKISPHVTLFQRFVSTDEWYKVNDKIELINKKIKFNKLEIFNLTNKFALVLTSDDDDIILKMRNKIEKQLNLNIESKPHITLGIFDNLKKANTIKSSIDKLDVSVNLNNVSFMKKLGEQYAMIDFVGENPKVDVIELILLIAKNFGDNFEYQIIGSRAYGIKDSDYDIILIGDVEQEFFGYSFASFAKMSPYFTYAKYIESKIPTINLILADNNEVNLIYQIRNKICSSVNNSIESVKEVYKLIGEKKDIFVKSYNLVRIWAKRRNIYGSKYGYFNGVTWLILTLNLFLKIEVKNEKMFIRKFFEYYRDYDWKIPVNIKNLSVKRETKSDELVYICNVIDKDKLVRTLSPTTWNIILQEFERTRNIKDLNIIFEKKEISGQYVKITINDSFVFNRLEKKNQMTSEIWKLCIKTKGIIPYIDWIDKDNSLIYKFGINGDSDIDVITSYFRKYLSLIEILI